MADARLNIIIDATNKAIDDLKDVKKQLGDIESPAKKASGGIGGVVKMLGAIGALAAAKKIAGIALELGTLGAEAERAEASFMRMAGGEREAAALLDALKVATLNTKSELELMNGATTLLALGLADSSAELTTIMQTVEALGSRFGGTMQIFQLMMSNKSLMRIDSFGLGVEEVTKRIEELKVAGMDADKAFDTAVLELMAQKYEDLGGAMDDNLTKIQQGKAAWADLKAEVGQAFSGMTAAAGESTAGFATWFRDVMRYTNDARKEFGYLSGSIEGMAKILGIERMTLDGFAESMDELGEAGEWSWGGGATRILDSAEAWELYARGQQATAENTKLVIDATYGSLDAWEDYNMAAGLAQGYTDTYTAAQARAKEESWLAADAFHDAAAALEEMSKAQFAAEQIENLRKAMEDGLITDEEYAAAKRSILVQFGLLTAAEEQAQKDIDAITKAFMDGKMEPQEYARLIGIVKDRVDGLNGTVIRIGWDVAPPPPGFQEGGWNMAPTAEQMAQAGFYASGGVSPGGASWVGEHGPELLDLPAGARVMSNPVTNNVTNNYNLNMTTRASTSTLRQDFALMRAMG